MKLKLYYHTLCHLTLKQIYYQLIHKLVVLANGFGVIKPALKVDCKGNAIALLPCVEKSITYLGKDTFCFLGLTHVFTAWDDVNPNTLWRYNLNYMDFVLQQSLPVCERVEWIERFIQDISTNNVAFDAYPISLRGINWIKFLSETEGLIPPMQRKEMDGSLYAQYRWLARHTERHLMANHYLENGISLLFGAVYFKDRNLMKRARTILLSQLHEQILADGAHCELSPMYHCVILERLLDSYNLIQCNKTDLLDDSLVELIKISAQRMLGWINTISFSDGNYPLLNDAAYDGASSVAALQAYANRLGLVAKETPLQECGYRRFNCMPYYEAIVDVGALGLSYNLGHAHADSLQFLLNVDGKPFIVDTGTSTYDATVRRFYERSTRAHNTVCVNEVDSSHVWGAFRCAERARVTLIEDKPSFVRATHDGYKHLGLQCERSFDFTDSKTIMIHDKLIGKEQEAVAYFHLAPELKSRCMDETHVEVAGHFLTFEGALQIDMVDVEVAKEYNRLEKAKCLCVHFNKELSTKIQIQTYISE